jgi:hypothetical protein
MCLTPGAKVCGHSATNDAQYRAERPLQFGTPAGTHAGSSSCGLTASKVTANQLYVS